MFENVKAIVETKVGDDVVAATYITNLDLSGHWLQIAENPRTIIDITSIHLLPARGSTWDGTTFSAFTHHPPLPGFLYFAFVVNEVCVHVQVLDPQELDQAALVAAYRSNPTFEAHYAE